MRCCSVLKLVMLGAAIAVPAAIGQLRSDGVVYNYGRLVIKGNAQFRQDTLGGTVVYAWDRTDVNQYIPHLVYEDVRFTGRTRKMLLDSLRALVALRRLETDTGTTLRLVRQSAIVARGEARHQGIINPEFLFGRVVLQGEQAQGVSGRGALPRAGAGQPRRRGCARRGRVYGLHPAGAQARHPAQRCTEQLPDWGFRVDSPHAGGWACRSARVR
jgi:hypothetical protein